MIKIGDAFKQRDPLKGLYHELIELWSTNPDLLSDQSRTIYFSHLFVDEIFGNGFIGYFVSSVGEFSSEILRALTTIGATVSHSLLSEALSTFPANFSYQQRRDSIIDRDLECPELEALDERFYSEISIGQTDASSSENLDLLMLHYMEEHKNDLIQKDAC